MSNELIAALTAAGVVDTDVAKLANSLLPVDQAVADLKARYPTAFRQQAPAPGFDIWKATKAEREAEWRRLQGQDYQRGADVVQKHQMARYERQLGRKV